MPEKGFLDVAPELVIEIFSPGDNWKELQIKIEEYFSIGVKWVWVLKPQERTLLLYRSNTEVEELSENNTLKGEDILAGFELKISSLFEE